MPARPEPDAAYFEHGERQALRADHVTWIRGLFDLPCKEFERLNLDNDDFVGRMEVEFEAGLEGLSEAETKRRRLMRFQSLTRGRRSSKFGCWIRWWMWRFG